VQHRLDLGRRHPERQPHRHDGAHAAARHVIDGIVFTLETLDHAGVGKRLGAAGAEREPELRAREVTREP